MMGWESSDVVIYHLWPLLQGQMRTAKLKRTYNSLVIGPRGLQCETKMGWESCDGIWPWAPLSRSNNGSLTLLWCPNLHWFSDTLGLVFLFIELARETALSVVCRVPRVKSLPFSRNFLLRTKDPHFSTWSLTCSFRFTPNSQLFVICVSFITYLSIISLSNWVIWWIDVAHMAHSQLGCKSCPNCSSLTQSHQQHH